ncbi:MAG: 3'(2'),5'-bisphosphate nucleotidase [Acidobacteria bacterium]|jgi:3'(2'), 5'-bisphosphate nucleotidase|nr:3'(2'),5'-bisphosphate nucleotidase [Acidobacteriota bacterium]
MTAAAITKKPLLQKEKEIGLRSVSAAMAMSAAIQKELTSKDMLTKSDRSPVTIADFASQALICKALGSHFPGIPIVGEEDSQAIRRPENHEVFAKVVHYLRQYDPAMEEKLICDLIDMGGDEPNGTFWTLDPIDGTKGFLRGEQFAIALALVQEGQVLLGILGCPNLERSAGGTLFWAGRGKGSWRVPANGGVSEAVHASAKTNTTQMRFVESYESSHSDKDTQLAISQRLLISSPPEQMDSQVKYGIVASGAADIYLRIPNPASRDYREKIWDHAAGSLIVEEAGGRVSDIDGKQLDFSAGKTLAKNRGILASNGAVHERVLQIIAEMAAKK